MSFFRQYPPITSSNIRRAYKNEFAELYKEYRLLYARIAQVAALFTRLEQELKRAQPLSPHHQVRTTPPHPPHCHTRHAPTTLHNHPTTPPSLCSLPDPNVNRYFTYFKCRLSYNMLPP